VVNDITTFGQTLMQVFGSFKLVLDDKDSHDLSPLLFNGYLIKKAPHPSPLPGGEGTECGIFQNYTDVKKHY
jgi:hypothetical protein